MKISLLNRLFLSCCVVLPKGGTMWNLLQQMQMIYIKCPFKEKYYNSVDMLLNTFFIAFSCSSGGMLQRWMLQFQQRLKTNGILLMSLSCWCCTINNAASPWLHLAVLLLLAWPSEKNSDSLMYWISYLISSINVTCWYLMGLQEFCHVDFQQKWTDDSQCSRADMKYWHYLSHYLFS